MGDHLDRNQFIFITNLSHYPVILGIAWLKLHDPEMSFGRETMLFNSEYCQKHCNVPLRPTRIHAVPDVPPKDRPENVVRQTTSTNEEQLKPVMANKKQPETTITSLNKLDIAAISLKALSMIT